MSRGAVTHCGHHLYLYCGHCSPIADTHSVFRTPFLHCGHHLFHYLGQFSPIADNLPLLRTLFQHFGHYSSILDNIHNSKIEGELRTILYYRHCRTNQTLLDSSSVSFPSHHMDQLLCCIPVSDLREILMLAFFQCHAPLFFHPSLFFFLLLDFPHL